MISALRLQKTREIRPELACGNTSRIRPSFTHHTGKEGEESMTLQQELPVGDTSHLAVPETCTFRTA
ncbi:MAG: hypothetical protein HGA97_05215 [Chlorobiaceae bacterium]|nr:hypothetical protein [Chlorobiaceae bacterium]